MKVNSVLKKRLNGLPPLRFDVLFNILEKIMTVVIKLAILYLIIKDGGSVIQGQYKYVTDIAVIFNIVVLLGLDNYNIFLMTKSYKENDKTTINAIITHNLVWVCLTFLPMFGLVYLCTNILHLLEPVTRNFIFLVSFVSFSFQFRYLTRSLWIGVGSIIYNSVYQIITDVLFLFYILYAYVNGTIDIYSIFIFLAFLNIGFTVFTFVQLFLRTKYRPRICWSVFSMQIKGGTQLFLYTIFFVLMLRVDSLIIMKLLGSSSTGYYGIASQYSEFAYFIVIAVSQIIIKETALNGNRFIGEWLRKVQLVQILAAIILAIFSFLLPQFLGTEYYNAIVPALILLIGAYFWGLFIFYNYWLLGLNKLKYLVLTSAIGVVLNTGLNIGLVSYWGLVGSAIASSISYTTSLLLLLFLIKKDGILNLSMVKSLFPI